MAFVQSEQFNHFDIEIKKRQFDINLSEEKITSWANNDVTTAYFNAISSTLPIVEKVIINAVNNFKNAVQNPLLKNQIEDFTRQEARHVGFHHQYNQFLLKRGYKLTRMNRCLQATVYLYTKIFTPRHWLAIIVAYEHLLACVGDHFYRNLSTTNWDSNFLKVWQFHLAEEIEHKSIAFDVYTEINGNNCARIIIMVYVFLAFMGRILYRATHFLRKDQKLWKLQTFVEGSKFFLGRKGIVWSMLKGVLQYMKPRFHPWDYNNYFLVTAFDQELDKSHELL